MENIDFYAVDLWSKKIYRNDTKTRILYKLFHPIKLCFIYFFANEFRSNCDYEHSEIYRFSSKHEFEKIKSECCYDGTIEEFSIDKNDYRFLFLKDILDNLERNIEIVDERDAYYK